MGRCCSLFTRSTCRNPLQIAPTATALPYTYSIPYPMLAFIYNIYYCHHRHVSLFLLSFFLAPGACTKGVQALGSVKRLETIVLLWRYINKIKLNWIELN